jgi:hypothetical protein
LTFNKLSRYYFEITNRSIKEDGKVEYGIQIVEAIKDKMNELSDDEKQEFKKELLNIGPIGFLKGIYGDLNE